MYPNLKNLRPNTRVMLITQNFGKSHELRNCASPSLKTKYGKMLEYLNKIEICGNFGRMQDFVGFFFLIHKSECQSAMQGV